MEIHVRSKPCRASFSGVDYFNLPADNVVYNRGPAMDLTNSPSYPSGHTTWGYTGAVLLAILVPERYQQMIARGAEYGNDRILMASHYAMDVLAGRTLALYDMAHLLADEHFLAAVKEAQAEVRSTLKAACSEDGKKTIQQCASEDSGRFRNPDCQRGLLRSHSDL